MKLSLGPLLYCWPKLDVYKFYTEIATCEINAVYIGESICSKRKELLFNDWIHLAHLLKESGKQVIISTLALVESPSKLNDVKRAVNHGEFIIEANDLSAVNLCAERTLPFVAGHALNIYNAIALKRLLNHGMQRWCMPVELSKDWLIDILNQADELAIRSHFEVEVFSYGYLPLAYSARCFTARAEQKKKADCKTCCLQDKTGRAIYSQDSQRLFTMNGIQTQSGACYNLIHSLSEMRDIVDYVRLSPLDDSTLTTIQQFRTALDDQTLSTTLEFPTPTINDCNGYWYGQPGMYHQVPTTQLSVEGA